MRRSNPFSLDHGALRFAAGTDFPIEAQFLLLCVRRELALDTLHVARCIATRPDFDWDRLMQMVIQHGIAPFIRARFDAVQSWGVPQEFSVALNKRCRAIAFRNLQLVGELIRLDEIFSDAGIRAVWFKGPILASQAYRNLTMRHFCDLDILIPREQVGEFTKIIQQQGYAPVYNVATPQKQRLHEKVSNALSFNDPKRGIVLDVHWAMANRNYSFLNDAPMPTTQVEVAGRRVTTFAAGSTLSYLCYHGCKHGWSSFQNILDVAEFIRSNSDLAWDTLTTAAQLPIGAPRMLKLGLALAHLGAGVRLPPLVIEWIGSDGKTPALAAKVLERCLLSPTPFDRSIYLATMESWADRMRHVMSIVWTPSVLEIEHITIPENLFFVYRGVRFVRLFRKHILTRAIKPRQF